MRRVEVVLPPDLAAELRAEVDTRRAALPPGAIYLAGQPLVDLYRVHLAEHRSRLNMDAAALASRYEAGHRPASRGEAEGEILQTLIKTTDPQTRGRLKRILISVGNWDRQIRALARRWRCDGVELEEFQSAGLQGLMEAADRYDGRPSGWPTYATTWIRRRVQELARLQGGPLVAITHHEARKSKETGSSRRAAGWAQLDPGADDDQNAHLGEVGAAITELQQTRDQEQEDQDQRARLAVMIKRLPPDLRAALAPELRGKSTKTKVDPAVRASALQALKTLMTDPEFFAPRRPGATPE